LADRHTDGAAEFADWLASEGRAPNTVAAYRRDVDGYLRWCTTAGVDIANPLAAYVAHVRATRKPSSAARAIVALRIFHRWRDDTPLPELVGLPIPTAADAEPDVTEQEIGAVIAASDGESLERRRDAVAVALLYFGGLKASEAISLDVDDLAGDLAAVTVDRDGPHERLLPVVPALRQALSRWLEPKGRARLHPVSGAVLVNRRGQRLTRQGLWLVIGAVGKRARLEAALSPNDLRRACASHLVARGVAPSQVSAFLGTSRGHLPTSGILNQSAWGSCNLTA
jgi:integrase/recombinase XerD